MAQSLAEIFGNEGNAADQTAFADGNHSDIDEVLGRAFPIM